MGKRVLVADDSTTIQRAFAMVFGGRDDISLIPARTMDEAISAARQGRPDLVIADAGLGNRSGYDLCAAVKSDPGLRGTPVFILASNHTPYDEGRGREVGADGHLIKPFESQALIDRVSELLARAPAPSAPAPSAAPPAASRSPFEASFPASRAPAMSMSSGPSAPLAPPGARPPAVYAAAPAALRNQEEDDDYGEFRIERAPSSGAVQPAARPGAPPPAPSRPMPVAAAPAAAPGLRPSLIPGTRPGIAPGRVPFAPPANPPPVASAARPAPAAPMAPQPAAPAASALNAPAGAVSRTIMGLPAVAIPGVPSRPANSPGAPGPGPGGAGGYPVANPGMPAARPTAVPAPAGRELPFQRPGEGAPGLSARVEDRLNDRLNDRMAAISARGPEYEAIAKLSREIIEQVVWEVVPELAEVIVREHVERLAAGRK